MFVALKGPGYTQGDLTTHLALCLPRRLTSHILIRAQVNHYDQVSIRGKGVMSASRQAYRSGDLNPATIQIPFPNPAFPLITQSLFCTRLALLSGHAVGSAHQDLNPRPPRTAWTL